MYISSVTITNPRTTSEFETQMDHIHHDKHQLIFAHNNIGSITIDGRRFPYKPGTVYYAPKGVSHMCENKIGTDYFILFFTVSSPALEEELQSLSYEIQPNSPSYVQRLIWQMYMYKYSKNPAADFYVFSCFTMLLTSLMNNAFYLPIINDESPMSKPTNILNNSFDKLLEFIQAHYTTDISIERMTKVSGYQRAQLFRIFNKRLGTTPHKYINSLRISASKTLLDDHNISITNIALSVGFKSTPVFTRAFYNSECCSPSDYRARHKR